MNRVVHFDISAENPEKLAKFYEDVFEWKFKEWMRDEPIEEKNRYWLIMTGEKDTPGINGGMGKRQMPMAKGGPNGFVNSIDVSDIEKSIEKIKLSGGKTQEIMDIMGVGKMAFAEDPEGNMFGIIQMNPDAKMQDM